MRLFYLIVVCFYLSFVSTNNEVYKNNTFIDKTVGKNTRRIQRSIFKGLTIFPGTKWCGPGDIASHNYDFGRFNQTDKCCRNHDLCHPLILPRQSWNGIENKEHITILSCSCDMAFYKCLKAVNSKVSRIIGKTYFNLLHRHCFYFNTKNEVYDLTRVPDFSNGSFIKFLSVLTRNYFKKNSH